jgi:hypothetical protein
MAEINYSVISAAAAVVLTACTASALANDANTNAALVTLEKSAYDAWKSKDAKYWDFFLSDRFVGWGSSRLDDRRSAVESVQSFVHLREVGSSVKIRRIDLIFRSSSSPISKSLIGGLLLQLAPTISGSW